MNPNSLFFFSSSDGSGAGFGLPAVAFPDAAPSAPTIAPVATGDGGLTRGAAGAGFGFQPGTGCGRVRGTVTGDGVAGAGSTEGLTASACPPPPATGLPTVGCPTTPASPVAPIVGRAGVPPPPGMTRRDGGLTAGIGWAAPT